MILGAILLAYFALASGYATLTPLWQNPDEPAHYNYIAFVARTGTLPELRPGDWDLALLERLKNGAMRPDDSVEAIRYEAWQPPLFYLAAAPVFLLGPEDPGASVARLRAFNIVLGTLTLGIAFAVARHVLPDHLAAAVPAVMAGMPMFTAVAAAISADPLANLLAATILLVLVRRLESESSKDQGSRWPVGAGGLLGLGLLTKLALAIYVPLALAVALTTGRRHGRDALLLIAATGLVVAPWFVHQVTTYGWLDPLATTRHALVVADQPRFQGVTPGYLGEFLKTTFQSFWAQFGWMSVVAPGRLYWTWGLLVLAAVGGLGRCGRRFREARWQLLVGTIVAALLGYLAYNLAFEQFQGRYLFTALVPMAILLVAGWSALLGEVQNWAVGLVAVGLIGLNAYTLLRVLGPAFAPTG